MSRILSRLRFDLRDALLVRSGGGMKRTPRGIALLEQVAAVLQQADALYRGGGFDPATAVRIFRAAIPDAVAAPLLPELTATMAREAPGCRLDVIPWPRRDDVTLAGLDFAIGTELGIFPHFRVAPLFEDRDVLVTYRPELAGESMKVLLALPHVAVVPAGMDHDPVDTWLASFGAARRIGAVVPHYLQALLLAARSDLVTILPSRLVAAVGPPFGLGAIELPVAQDPDLHYLFHPPERDADPPGQWMRALVRHVIGEISPAEASGSTSTARTPIAE